MKRDFIDFFLVEPHQLPMHERLMNWSRWVKPGIATYPQPIWALGKSNGRQWHVPVLRETVDTLDAMKIEKAVGALPSAHRDAIRWAYVFPYVSVTKMRRVLGLTNEGLAKHINDSRIMLVNRGI
jgi:hypothetical protein